VRCVPVTPRTSAHNREVELLQARVVSPKVATEAGGASSRPDDAHGRRDRVFDAVGALTVVVDGAEPADLRAVARDLGTRAPQGRSAAGDACMVVRFVDDLAPEALHLLDGGRMGYGSDGVYVLEPATGRPLARVSQKTSWGSGSIECTRGLTRVPLLSAAVGLAALAGGWAPLHAAAWTMRDGVRVLASGWPGSGKTGALLAACENGATPIGDERVLLARNGQAMAGLGNPVEIKHWHLAQLRLPLLGASRGRRSLARVTYALDKALDRRLSRWSRTAHKALRRAGRLASTELDVVELGAPRDGRARGSPDVLLLLEAHSRDSVAAEPANPVSVPARLTAHVAAELAPALRIQRALDYVSPGAGWRDVHRSPDVAREILESAVRGIPAWLVRHPYPCSLKDLNAVISRVVTEAAS
jgi:hypothetical protein